MFGTVHAPLFNPVLAAKEMVTADQIGRGRFGLNIVIAWNDSEFRMFGVEQRKDHEDRYAYGQDWIDAIKRMWGPEEEFDFLGKTMQLRGLRLPAAGAAAGRGGQQRLHTQRQQQRGGAHQHTPRRWATRRARATSSRPMPTLL